MPRLCDPPELRLTWARSDLLGNWRVAKRSMANLFRAAFVSAIALAFLQGCSLDLPSPTAWLGGDDDTKTKDGEFPSLSEVPDRPKELSSQAEKRKSAESLSADGQNANYTAETLRGDSFTPAFAPQPASNVSDALGEASPTADQPVGDSDAADDQRSELPAANKNAALAPAPPAQPIVPVHIEESAPVPSEQATQSSSSVESVPAVQSMNPARQKEPRKVSLSGSTYSSKFAASARDEDKLRRQKASFAQSTWNEESNEPQRRIQANIDLLLDDVSSESRSDVFQDQLVSSAVITDAPNQLAAFAPAAGPGTFEGQAGMMVASARAVQGNRSPALNRRGDRRYTATLMEERRRAERQLVADRSVLNSPDESEAIVLARTNASGFTLSAAETLEASSAMAASVAKADVKTAPDGLESVPPFKTLTFARAAVPDLTDVEFAMQTVVDGGPSVERISQTNLQVATTEPRSIDPVSTVADRPDIKSPEDVKEEVQPPEITLFFADGAVQIEESDETDLERIADVQQQNGGAVRVVTHVPSLSDDEEQGSRLSLQASLERARAVSKRMMKLGVHPTAVVVETRFDEEETAERVVQNANSDLRVEVFLE